jgi:hypothetical protein
MANGDLWACGEVVFPLREMSTSIVSIYTGDGFVVAADGRKYNVESECVINDDTQKVFQIKQPDRELVYAMSGTIELTAPGTMEVTFDFSKKIGDAIDELAPEKHKSLWHYAEALSKSLTELPPEATQAVKGDEDPTIIYLDGYYGGQPKRAKVTLFYDGQIPEVTVQSLHRGVPEGLGSPLIWLNLVQSDPIAAKCLNDPDSVSQLDAIEIAKKWMSAHSAPGAVKLDPICKSIGGRILICTVTRTDGFRWVQGPKDA